MAYISIITGNSLCHNPRVIKEADALGKNGFKVEILGAWLNATLKRRDQELLIGLAFRFTPVLDVTSEKFSAHYGRLRVKAARWWHEYAQKESAWQLGYTIRALNHAVKQRRETASLFIAHSESALWVISQLQNQKSEVGNHKFQVGVDMEDWFSEDLLPEARKQRPVKLLKSLEQGALSKASHSTCTSRAMSEALAKEYDCPPPTVIYNAFPWADRQQLDGQFKDRRIRTIPSLHWYSQTLGAGRGLEELFAALTHVRLPMEVHLRGHFNAATEAWLRPLVPERWQRSVFLHPLVSNEELLSRIAEHDIGFAGEQTYARSRDLTVTNKILHYLLGGLAVIASDTAGQREIAAQAEEAVQLYPAGKAEALAQRLNLWLEHPDQLAKARAAALKSAENVFCWERQAPKLIHSVQSALIKPRI